MTRLPARLVLAASTAIVLAAPLHAPAFAQQNPNTFTLPTATPTPAPAPAGPADERAGVAIPPRAVPKAAPTTVPIATPSASAAAPPPRITLPAPVRTAPAPSAARTATTVPAPVPAATSAAAPLPAPTISTEPFASPSNAPLAIPTLATPEPESSTDTIIAMPTWQLAAGGGLVALALFASGIIVWRRRKPKVLRLAAAPAIAEVADAPTDLNDLHLTLDITTATRSLMMFSLGYRLNIANRSGRAVNDLRVAVQLACARASGGVPSVGAAQTLGEVERIGPHQARSITGDVRLPLSAIQPLRQGTTPLFVPLVHVTLEGEGQPALTRTFVIGTPSASGRVHPIILDPQPGGIAGLVAQAVSVPAVPAAA